MKTLSTLTTTALVVMAAVVPALPASAANVEITPGAGSVTASTSDSNVAANVVDNNYSTRWSGDGDGASLQLDLGSSKTVSHLKVAVYKGDERKNSFDLQLWNGTAWATVFSGSSSGSTTGLQTFDFTDQAASKVRYVGHGYTLNAGGTGTWNSVTEVEVWGSDGGTTPPGGDVPADILNLTNWKITLPTGADESPTEVKQPALATFSVDPYFKVVGDAVQFRAPVNGVTTSGSGYPRSELREMTSNGSANASWSSTSGTHTLTVSESFDHLPADKPQLVGAQIHDADDDVTVFRLEGSSLYITNGDTTHYKLVTSTYALGTVYEAKFVVSGGQVKAYYNGVLQTTISKSFSGAYFKAGAYTQANCTNSSPCAESNYGQTTIHNVTVTHS